MTIDRRRTSSLIYYLYIGAIINSTHAKLTYLIQYKPQQWHNTPYEAQKEQADHRLSLEKLLNLITKEDELVEKNRKLCGRLFGSIYGTMSNRIRCLETLKENRLKRDDLKSSLLGANDAKYEEPFVDFTRVSEDSDFQNEAPAENQYNRFSTDYIDFENLRSSKRDSNRAESRKSSKRMVRGHTRKPKRKAAYSSSDDDSDSSMDVKKSRSKKPKRFHVIHNGPKSDSSQSFSEENKGIAKTKPDLSEEDIESSFSTELLNTESPKDNHLLSSVLKPKYVKPLKTKDDKKNELYLQGHRTLKLDGRKRLIDFFPKRFYWEPDEIHHLGYYWFNGPQGKYPYFSQRP